MAQMSKISKPKDDGALAYNYRHCASMTSQAVVPIFCTVEEAFADSAHLIG